MRHPIKIEKSGSQWAVVVLGIPIGFVKTKDEAKSAAHTIGLLGKMRRVLDKFRDKRREDEAFADSLTDEERQIIRDRRGNTAGKDK